MVVLGETRNPTASETEPLARKTSSPDPSNFRFRMLPELSDLFKKACDDFHLISPGDRIMVGLSGGKDSLTICHLLCLLRDSQPAAEFEILATHIQFTNIPYRSDLDYLHQFCNDRRVTLDIVEDDIRQAHIKGEHLRLTCVHCARFRRAKLLELTRLRNCNKLTLGHHLDDIVATLLINMSQHGKFGGMAVKLDLRVGEQQYPVQLIRPLCYIGEDDIRSFAQEQGFNPEKCRCDWSDDGIRAKVREAMELLCRDYDQVKTNIFQSQFKIGGEEIVGDPYDGCDIEDAAGQIAVAADE
jgi:tRNA(Ile)-lysidine synthase TilS/MesJ